MPACYLAAVCGLVLAATNPSNGKGRACIVQRFSLKCLIGGHDDVLRRTPSRLYLQCDECGRETGGWEITGRSDPSEINSASPRPFVTEPKLFFTQPRSTAESLLLTVRRAIDAFSASRLLRFWRDNLS